MGRFKRGVTERGYPHLLASKLSLCAAGPATVLSHKYDIPACGRKTKLRVTIACRYIVGACGCCNIVLSSLSRRKMPLPLVSLCWFSPCLNLPDRLSEKKKGT